MAHVLLPCDMPNWEELKDKLKQICTVENSEQLINLMLTLHDTCGLSLDPDNIPKCRDKTRFSQFKMYLDEQLSSDERDYFFKVILKAIVNLALEVKSLKPEQGVLYSLPQEGATFTLQRRFVTSLLSHAFFSTFPKRTTKSHPTLRDFNFGEFFRHLNQQSQKEKLQLFLNYFKQVEACNYKGEVTIFRQVLPLSSAPSLPTWLCCDRPLCSALVRSLGTISSAEEELYKVCCCDQRVGGDVLTEGTDTQESALFFQVPELLVLLLFVEALQENEALLVHGALQVNESYDSSQDKSALEIDVCLMGTRDFSICPIQQYEDHFLLQELNKAMTAFQQPSRIQRPSPVGKSSSSSACHETISDCSQLETQKCSEQNSQNTTICRCKEYRKQINSNSSGISVNENQSGSLISSGLNSRSLDSSINSDLSSFENYESPMSTGSSRADSSVSYQRLESYETSDNHPPYIPPENGLRSIVGRIFSPLSSESLQAPSDTRSFSVTDSEKGLTMLIDRTGVINENQHQELKITLTTRCTSYDNKSQADYEMENPPVDFESRTSFMCANNDGRGNGMISSQNNILGSNCSYEDVEMDAASMFFTPPSTLPRPSKKRSLLSTDVETAHSERRESAGSQASQQRPLQLTSQLTSPSSGASSEGAPSTEARDQLAPLVPISIISRARPRLQSSGDDEFFTPRESFEDDTRNGADLGSGITSCLLRETIIRGLRKSGDKRQSTSDSSQGDLYIKPTHDNPIGYIRDDERDTMQSHVSRCDSAGFVLESDFDNSSLNLSIHERYEDFRRRIQRRSRRLSKRSSRSSARQSSSGSSDMDDIIEDPELGFSSVFEPVPIRPSSSEPSLTSLSTSPEPALRIPPISILTEYLTVNKCKKMMVTNANGQLKAYSYDGVNPNLPVPFKAKFRCRSIENGNDVEACDKTGAWEEVYTAAAAACAAAVAAASEGTSMMESADDFKSTTEDKDSEQSQSDERNSQSESSASDDSSEALVEMQTPEGIRGVAVGQWGDPRFCGDVQMKSIILWLAASMVGLPCIVMYSGGDKTLGKMPLVIKRAKANQWSVGDLACELLRYCRDRVATYSCEPRDDLNKLPEPTLFNQLLSGDSSFVSNDSLD